MDEDNHKALLLSRYGLDEQPYNTANTEVTWETSSLRAWLNDEFIRNAFSSAEQGSILLTVIDNSKSQCCNEWDTNGGNNTRDRVFLLSYAEANKYFGVSTENKNNMLARTSPTDYAYALGAYAYGSNTTAEGKISAWWWLRSPGRDPKRAALILSNGYMDDFMVNRYRTVVRPALWIDLGSLTF